jgi:hypothetical protein
MQRHTTNSNAVILPAVILGAFLLAIGCVVILTFNVICFVTVKLVGLFNQPQPQAVSTIYPEQVMAAIFQEDIQPPTEAVNSDRVETEVRADEGTVMLPDAVCATQQRFAIANEVAVVDVEPVVPPQNDETLIQIDQALLLLRGVNRKGWHKMLGVIGEEKSTKIPPSFKQMTKNKSRADALLKLKVSAELVSRARELALRQQAS